MTEVNVFSFALNCFCQQRENWLLLCFIIQFLTSVMHSIHVNKLLFYKHELIVYFDLFWILMLHWWDLEFSTYMNIQTIYWS